MEKSEKDIFEEKVNLICEYNSKSPLFVRQANTEIRNNNIEKAIEILKNGIQIFPDYPTAYIILGKAYSIQGEYTEAENAFTIGCNLIYSPDSLLFYKNEIEKIKKQKSAFEGMKRSTFIDEEKEQSLFENFNDSDENNYSVDDDLSLLAEKLSNAKLSSINEHTEIPNNIDINFQNNVIVSETLAKIYFAQGEYKEAITIYEKLLEKFPEKQNYFSQKIVELSSLISSRK